MTCSMISRNKNAALYSVAKSSEIDAKKELVNQISSGNIHQNLNKNDSNSTANINNNAKKLPLIKSENIKTNTNFNGKINYGKKYNFEKLHFTNYL